MKQTRATTLVRAEDVRSARRTGRRVVSGLAAVLVTAALGVATAPAAAAATCHGYSCTGQDPEATGCAADAQTVREYNTGGIRVQLRFSIQCQAGWVRAIAPQDDYRYLTHHVAISAYYCSAANDSCRWGHRSTTVRTIVANTVWSRMIGRYTPNWRLYLRVADDDDPSYPPFDNVSPAY
jgi:hypothetical protein